MHVVLELEDAVRLHAEHGPLDLGGPVVQVHTDDFAAIDYQAILRAVRVAVPTIDRPPW